MTLEDFIKFLNNEMHVNEGWRDMEIVFQSPSDDDMEFLAVLEEDKTIQLCMGW